MTELSSMDSFETPYDDDDVNDFITCTVCEKSIKGNSLYKIHLTTSRHLKKEDELVAQGLVTRDAKVPIFDDILQYLNYLQLGEPIIGLSVLQQTTVGSAERTAWPIYTCHMCKQNLNLPEMVHHLIGRKHRLKYMQSKWPDMVSGDLDSCSGAKIIRNKAEIVERQEGRGCPTPMKNIENVWQSQNAKANKRQNLQGNASFSKFDSAPTQHVDHFQQGRNIPDYSFDQDVPRGFNGDRQEYQREDELGYSVQRRNWMGEGEEDRGRQFSEPDFQRLYDKVLLDSPSPVVCKPVFPRYNLREEPARGHALYEEHSSDADRDRRKDWFSDNTKHERDYCSSDLEAPMRYGDAEKQWSPADVCTTREGQEWRGPNKSVPQSSFSSNVNSASLLHGRVLVKDYNHRISEYSPNERFDYPAPTSAATFLSSVDIKNTLSRIPEPFMRFLEGSANHKGSRKRSSRFSDATAEEVATARKAFKGEYSSMFNGTSASDWRPNQAEPRSSSSLSFRTEKGSIQSEFSQAFSSNVDGPLKRGRVPNQAEFRSQYSSGSEGPSRRESGLSMGDFSSEYSSGSEGPSWRGSGLNQTESQPEYSSILDGPMRRERGPVDRLQSSSLLGGPPRSERSSSMAEGRARHHSVYQKDLQDFPSGIHQREGSGPEAVLDMLDDVQIENEDDAKFLKNKLLTILDEYKAKKMERAEQNNRGRNEEYSSPGSKRSQERPFESRVRDDGDMRRSNNLNYRDDQFRGGCKDDYGPAKGGQDCRPPVPTENKRSSRGDYEEVFGMDYRLAPNKQFDRSAGPARDLDPRRPRSMQHSSNIDKLNSTLMALIRRK